jgi:hypothetical protein
MIRANAQLTQPDEPTIPGNSIQGFRQSLRPSSSPKSIFFKDQGFYVPPMPVRAHHIAAILAVTLAGLALGACSSINEKLSAGVGDTLPHWAGGLPADVPPRRGTPEYEAYMKERERKRLEPAANNANAAVPTAASPASSAQPLDPVH